MSWFWWVESGKKTQTITKVLGIFKTWMVYDGLSYSSRELFEVPGCSWSPLWLRSEYWAWFFFSMENAGFSPTKMVTLTARVWFWGAGQGHSSVTRFHPAPLTILVWRHTEVFSRYNKTGRPVLNFTNGKRPTWPAHSYVPLHYIAESH